MNLKHQKNNENYDSGYAEDLPAGNWHEDGANSKRLALLIGVVALIALLLIIGCIKVRKKDSPDSMQSVFTQYMTEKGNALDTLDSLSEADKQKVLSTVIPVLERLIGDETDSFDKEAVISQLETILADLNLDLSADAIHTIAEKMVELYTSSYNEVYSDVKKNNTSIKHLGNTVTNQMQENLYTITDYLTQLNGEIENNQNTLDQIITSNETIHSSLTQLTEQTNAIRSEICNEYNTVQNRLTQVQDSLDTYFAKYDQNNAAVSSGITNIRQDITDTKNQLFSTMQVVADTLNKMEGNNLSRQEEINRNFSTIGNSIEATQKQMQKLEEHVSNAITELGKDMQDNQEELLDLLNDFETDLQKTLSENMVSIDTHFSALQKSVTDSFAQLQENLSLSVLELRAQMDDIHSQIQDTQTKITDILASMDEKSDLQYQDIMNAINTAVSSINAQMQDAHSNLETLILQLKANGKADHAETLQNLEKIEKSFSDSMNSSLSQINSSFSTLNASLAQYFEQLKAEQNAGQQALGNAIGDLGDNIQKNQQIILDGLSAHDSANRQGQQEIKDAISLHDTNMQTGHDMLQENLQLHNSEVLNIINDFRIYMGEKLDSVFQFVSNGKKVLASALLTKGVSIKEDASFAEFAEAILNIPQKLVIGVQEIPGEIEYQYHHHTDENGNLPHTETLSYAGGCYSLPVYHTHTGNASSGSGCYTSPVYHTHTDSCYSEGSHNSSCPHHTEFHPYDCGSVHDWDGDGHGCDGFIAYDCGGHSYLSCGKGNGLVGYSIGCGKDGRTIDAYRPGCGLSDGQIIGAHIIYDQSASNAVSYTAIIPEMDSDESDQIQETSLEQDETEDETEESEETKENPVTGNTDASGAAEVPSETTIPHSDDSSQETDITVETETLDSAQSGEETDLPESSEQE